jgi:hypothetical protein
MAVISATLLPWATHENRTIEVTTNYGAGAVGYVLAALALASAACALIGLSDRSARLQNLATVLSAGCLVTALVLAGSRIIAANDAAGSQVGGSRTSYEAGAVLAVLGSAALLISCFVLSRSRSRPGHAIAATP